MRGGCAHKLRTQERQTQAEELATGGEAKEWEHTQGGAGKMQWTQGKLCTSGGGCALDRRGE